MNKWTKWLGAALSPGQALGGKESWSRKRVHAQISKMNLTKRGAAGGGTTRMTTSETTAREPEESESQEGETGSRTGDEATSESEF